MKLLYSIGIFIANLVLKVLALFNSKLKQGVEGRKETFKKLKNAIKSTDKTFWFHCASLGEYEQGLPVFKALKQQHPDAKVVLTFFSPSGYEVRKNAVIADVVVYLPFDTKSNAKRFLDIVNPDYIVFVKYEIWPNFLFEIKKRSLNAILISAVFRKKQSFFKRQGSFMRSALFAFQHIFTQNEESKKLLESIDYTSTSVSGDTRFDRVNNQLLIDNTVSFIEDFKCGKLCAVMGSTWPEDDKLFIDYVNRNASNNLKFIIAPHNVKPSYTASLKGKIKARTIAFSEMKDSILSDYNVFILDTIGYLSKVYNYADIAYVGGGAGKTGLHNILEPAVFGIPIIIGKNYENFPEAVSLVKSGGVKSVNSPLEFNVEMDSLVYNSKIRQNKGDICRRFIDINKGAVIQIINYIRI